MFAFGGNRGILSDRPATATARAAIAIKEADATRIAQQAEIAAAVIQTLTAQPTASPTAAPSATATPTLEPTHTSTPDLTATKAAEQNSVLTAVAATQTALPTSTVTPTSDVGLPQRQPQPDTWPPPSRRR